MPTNSVNSGEVAADEHFAVTLHRNRINVPIRAGESILKTPVQSAVHVEPRDAVATYAVKEGVVQRSVRVEARNSPPAPNVVSSDQDLAIVLHRDPRGSCGEAADLE